MLPKLFVVTFHIGLLAATALALCAGVVGSQYLVWVGTIHMLALFAFGSRLAVPKGHLVVQTLHKTGFLHTLIGLGAAVAVVAAGAAQPEGASRSIGLAIAPIGAALLPHVMGVWFGHSIEMRIAHPETPLEDLHRRLGDLSAQTFRLLELVERELDELMRRLADLTGECVVIGNGARDAMRSLESSARASAASAREFSGSVADDLKVHKDLVVVHEQLLRLLDTPLFRTGREAGTGASR